MNQYTKYILSLKNSALHIEAAKRASFQIERGSKFSGEVSASTYQIIKTICGRWKKGILENDLKET